MHVLADGPYLHDTCRLGVAIGQVRPGSCRVWAPRVKSVGPTQTDVFGLLGWKYQLKLTFWLSGAAEGLGWHVEVL